MAKLAAAHQGVHPAVPMSSEECCISSGPAGSDADLSGQGVTQLISTQRPGPPTPLINFGF